jgi:macrolide transport system ATP-binding/permease protein
MNVGPGFLGTMQIPILLGREIDERDILRPTGAAVVNEVFARKWYPGESPLGRHFVLDKMDFEIVGVTRLRHFHTLKDDTPPVAFLSYSHNARQMLGQMVYVMRSAGDPLALAASARQADARVPISSLNTQSQAIDQTIWQERTFATLCTCFAVLAVLIACVGLYGMMAYSVARRTDEIGLRMALGARRPRLIWLVMREVFAMAVLGLAIGRGAALATTRLVQSFLFQMKANDPAALAGAAVTLLGAALAAGYAPAWRASRIDPWTALRDE